VERGERGGRTRGATGGGREEEKDWELRRWRGEKGGGREGKGGVGAGGGGGGERRRRGSEKRSGEESG